MLYSKCRNKRLQSFISTFGIFFHQPVKNNRVTYENNRKIATGQGDDYTTGCLLAYIYLKIITK